MNALLVQMNIKIVQILKFIVFAIDLLLLQLFPIVK